MTTHTPGKLLVVGLALIGARGTIARVAGNTAKSGLIDERTKADAARLALCWNEFDNLVEALLWCSGSQDFAPGGVAREGWLKLQPLIDQVKAQETP